MKIRVLRFVEVNENAQYKGENMNIQQVIQQQQTNRYDTEQNQNAEHEHENEENRTTFIFPRSSLLTCVFFEIN